ncbi:MAG: bifunctional DNA-formamidopyrimidine glycosylase/DNA-(apurinic or apyrimidinic site) lyase [Acidobacteriota bacterium]
MPELPEVEAVRRELAPILEGAQVGRVVLRRRNLRRPFPHQFDRRIAGATVLRLRRRAKYLLADLSSGDTLVMHLGMSGSFRVESADHRPEVHDHVVFDLSSGRSVVFNDPRRFGVMDLTPTGEVERSSPVAGLGPEPLSEAFDGAALAAACGRTRRPIKVALLDQSIVAGLGNIYASEALHRARVSPRLPAAVITARGAPLPSAHRLARAIKTVLTRAIDQLRHSERSQRFIVYDREGERCRRRGCTGRIRRITQAGRATFYCPVCQAQRK